MSSIRILSSEDNYTNYVGFQHPTNHFINLQGRHQPYCLFFNTDPDTIGYDQIWSIVWNSGGDSFHTRLTYFDEFDNLVCTTTVGSLDGVLEIPSGYSLSDMYIVPDSIIDDWYPLPSISSGHIIISSDQVSIDEFCLANATPDLDTTPNWELYSLGLTESGSSFMGAVTTTSEYDGIVIENGKNFAFGLIILVFGFLLADFIYHLYRKLMG